MKRLLQGILASLAKRVISAHNPIIIAITGSVGKSTTKEAVHTLLSEKFHVHKSPGNFNNEFGLPLTVLMLDTPPRKIGWIGVVVKAAWRSVFTRNYPDMLVLEFGIDHPGDMSYLCDIAPPDIAIMTGVEKVHVEYFKDIGELAHEKEMLLNLLKSESLALLNFDNERVREMIDRHEDLDIETYGLNRRADVWADSIEVTPEHTKCVIHIEEASIPVTLSMIGKHHIYSMLPAVALATHFEIPADSIAKRIEQMQPLPGRMTMLEGINGSIVMDSSYNAEPASMRASLETLHTLPGKRKVAVIGDMLELGDFSQDEHADIAKKTANIAELAIFVGPEMTFAYTYLKNQPYSQLSFFHFQTSGEAAEFIVSKIKEGDVILVKGSQGVRMERVAEVLLDNPERDREQLVRQSTAWKDKE